MTADKLKQFVAMIGGFLGAVTMFLGTLNVEFQWLNMDTIDSGMVMLGTAIPLVLVFYGIYKNQYLITKKAKEQEKDLIEKGMK